MANTDFQNHLPPQNIEAEQAVLGAIFRHAPALVEAHEIVEAADFYRRSHQLIYQAMVDLNDQADNIDPLTVANQLEKKDQLEDAGGRSYLSDLLINVPTAANVGFYAKIVEEKAILRRLIQVSQGIEKDAYEQRLSTSDILDQAEKDILKVSENRHTGGLQHISSIIQTNMDEIDRLYKNDEPITGLSTGYGALDAITAGLHPDELFIIAARPGVGKTAFALNVAQNVATKSRQTVAIFSLEMSAAQLVNRMICAEGSIDASRLRTGQLSEEEWQNLIVATGSLSDANIYIDDTPGIRTSEIRARLRRLKQENSNLGFVVIDYLQLIEGSTRESRQQEVSEISRQLKKISKELEVPVMALSQLSRSVESRQDKRPILSDLRESGSIEQDADLVGFLYRDDYYSDDDEEEAASDNIVEVIIEKNRHGARGTVQLLFIKEYNKFTSLTFRSDSEAPPAWSNP